MNRIKETFDKKGCGIEKEGRDRRSEESLVECDQGVSIPTETSVLENGQLIKAFYNNSFNVNLRELITQSKLVDT